MPAMAHAWEAPERGWEFDSDAPNVWADDTPDAEVDYNALSKAECEAKLFEYLIDLKQTTRLSAKQTCILAFWASKAGAGGDVSKLAMAPNCQSGKFSHRFDQVIGHPQEENYYYINIPRRHRSSSERHVDSLPTLPPLDACVQHVEKHRGELEQTLQTARLPSIYSSHPIVRGAAVGALVLPFALYLDAVSFSREDSILGIWMFCVLTSQRFLLCSLRKSEACKCGCRSWCSLFPIFQMINWSLRSLARGVHPSSRHDGSPLDGARASRANKPLTFHGAILFIKGDWCEYAHTLGFPDWNTTDHPCMMCNCNKASAFSLKGVSMLDLPWKKNDGVNIAKRVMHAKSSSIP